MGKSDMPPLLLHDSEKAKKQREEQTKEANQARGQLEVMRSRLAEYQRRVEAEEDASARVVTERDQKSGVIAELREQIAAQRQRIAELQAQRDQLINEANTVKTENKKHKKLLKEVHDQHATTQEHLQKLQEKFVAGDSVFLLRFYPYQF